MNVWLKIMFGFDLIETYKQLFRKQDNRLNIRETCYAPNEN